MTEKANNSRAKKNQPVTDRILPRSIFLPIFYRDPNAIQEEDKVTDEEKTEEISKNFTDKTNLLFEYIEKTYFDGDLDKETMRLIQKMHDAENYQPSEKKKVEYGFEAIFLNNQK